MTCQYDIDAIPMFCGSDVTPSTTSRPTNLYSWPQGVKKPPLVKLQTTSRASRQTPWPYWSIEFLAASAPESPYVRSHANHEESPPLVVSCPPPLVFHCVYTKAQGKQEKDDQSSFVYENTSPFSRRRGGSRSLSKRERNWLRNGPRFLSIVAGVGIWIGIRNLVADIPATATYMMNHMLHNIYIHLHSSYALDGLHAATTKFHTLA